MSVLPIAMLSGPISSWSIVDFLILIVILAACCGITIAALKYFEVTIPPVVIYIFWIVVVAVVAIFAIRLIASM